MQEFFPPVTRWTHPQGGLFLWSILPEGIDAKLLFKTAIEQNVAFVPGEYFFARGGGLNTMRLNFSNATPEKIRLGIERLGKVIREQMLENKLDKE
jgi:2-aminoadipate transaminase